MPTITFKDHYDLRGVSLALEDKARDTLKRYNALKLAGYDLTSAKKILEADLRCLNLVNAELQQAKPASELFTIPTEINAGV